MCDFYLEKDDMEDKTSLDHMENVIVLQDVAGPFQGLKPVDPGVGSAERPLNARNTFLVQNKSAEQSRQDSPSRTRVVFMISRANYREGLTRIPTVSNDNFSTRNKCVCSSRNP